MKNKWRTDHQSSRQPESLKQVQNGRVMYGENPDSMKHLEKLARTETGWDRRNNDLTSQ
jgi:hypothetical protein